MTSTPNTLPGNTVVALLRDLTDKGVPKTSKLNFACTVDRFLESRKKKVPNNQPPQTARIIKATTETASASEKVSQILGSPIGDGPFYDDAWDIRLARFGFQTFTSAQHHYQQGCRGPPDGAATCGSVCSLTSSAPSSANPMIPDSTSSRDSHTTDTVTTSIPLASTTVSTFTPSQENSANQPTTSSNVMLAFESKVATLQERDQADGKNPSNWFPPPPPTPLHLSLNGNKPICDYPGRYHEHRRSFEMSDDLMETKKNSDTIPPPPFSLPSPCQKSVFVNGAGLASVASSLVNLPPPLPLSEDVYSPPVIPPRDPKISVTTPNEPLITDLDWQQPMFEATPHINQKEEPVKAEIQQYQQKSGFDSRSVDPWENVGPPSSTDIDFFGNLPQWVPPQHSEAAVLHHRKPQSINHRASKSQSGCEGFSDKDRTLHPLGHASSCRSQSQHRRRRHTLHSVGEEFVDAVDTSTNFNSGDRGGAFRINSDSSGMAKRGTLFATGDLWADAIARDAALDLKNDSAGRFVRVGCNVRLHPATRSSAQHQRHAGTNQGKALASAVVANGGMMTQSLIDWPGYDNALPVSSSLHHQRQQQSICLGMKTVHLTDSGLVLSHEGTTSLPVYPSRQVLFTSTNTTSPDDVPSGGGYFFQSQVSCPPHFGGKLCTDEAAWGDGRVFQYQTAPAHAYPGQTYMLWPQQDNQSRRRHQNHHQPTQPIIVPAGGGTAFPINKRSTSTRAAPPQNGRPQILVAGPNCGKRMADLATLVSLPMEEQPWFHGRLPRAEAESLLRSTPPGSFLVRISETSKAAFSLSIRRDRDFLHMKISYDPKSEAFILGEYSQPYPTVPIMVHHYTRNLLPVRGTKPVLLKYPLYRTVGSFSLHTP